jgi:hypothetical protein
MSALDQFKKRTSKREVELRKEWEEKIYIINLLRVKEKFLK